MPLAQMCGTRFRCVTRGGNAVFPWNLTLSTPPPLAVQIVAMMPLTKQTLFFTATWPKAVARVAATILRNPIHVAIGSCDELRANKDIKQTVTVRNVWGYV